MPIDGLTREFAEGATPEDICARTIRALMSAGARHFYISNLPTGARTDGAGDDSREGSARSTLRGPETRAAAVPDAGLAAAGRQTCTVVPAPGALVIQT